MSTWADLIDLASSVRTVGESVPPGLDAPGTEPSPSVLPAWESLVTSARNAGTFTPAVRCTVETPPTAAVPTSLGSDSQRPGSMPSEEKVERTLALDAFLVARA